MIQTDLTAEQHAQLAALLADSIPHALQYRPPVERDVNMVMDLERVGLAQWTPGEGSRVTAAGLALVQARAQDAAEREYELRERPETDLRRHLDGLRAALPGVMDEVARGLVMADIVLAADELDRRAAVRADGLLVAAGRHHLTVFESTAVLPPLPNSGTLPLPVVPVEAPTEQFDAVADAPDEKYELAPVAAEPSTDQDEEDLENEARLVGFDEQPAPGWFSRSLTRGQAVVFAVVVAVCVIPHVVWLVTGR